MQKKIEDAIKLLNENGYIVSKVTKAQMAIAKSCCENKSRCNFNVVGVRCVDLLCVQDLIKEQIFPYMEQNEE